MMETRQMKRARKKEAQKKFKLPAGKFSPVDLNIREHPHWMTRAFINNRYVVMINDNAKTTHGTAIRAMVQRHDDTPIPNHWREMQNIKNELFGGETIAVEYYPRESELTDDHNIYWMFIYPNNILPIPID
ncbi:DUF7694 domain-containing protein [Mariniphaga sediminis]|uniref:DUF7694 domain-containing protein n=1 Tax=Mariniphaga sediminis TaxID=1628158 RepID=UPI003562C9D7